MRKAFGSPRLLRTLALTAALSCLTARAFAGDALVVGAASVDPPTIVNLGVQLLVSGDDNHDAKVTLRYRKSGSMIWLEGMPLHRVHPEVVTGLSVPDQFGGSVFDLAPGTAYDLELHATDADGNVDQIVPLTGTTRPVPASDPKTPNIKPVTDAATLSAALAAAQPGDVITLANGTYAGTFVIKASGTADNPIVIRGASEDGVILDGGGDPGNILEVYGSFVHVEKLTLQNANRALRFQGMGAEENVVRRVHVKNVVLGFGSQVDQKNFYLCDNILEGRLSWPAVYADDAGAHANDDGIHVEGNAHVVCHNQLKGFGDAMKIEEDGALDDDFYGNEVLTAYDNALELDTTLRNGRCIRNRFTNTYATISFQPIYGGPVYAIRNVVVNVANEQLKFHANGNVEPSGMYILHNTFVSPLKAVNLQTGNASHYFVVENNLFVGPAMEDQGKTFDWTGTIDNGVFDYDGFYPDGVFDFTLPGTGYQKVANFAAFQGAGFEKHGLVVGADNFMSGLVAPADYKAELPAPDVTLKGSSLAVDKGLVLPNVNDGYAGAGPDLGAIEIGCALPIYGVRPDGVDETNEMPCGGGSSGSGGGSASSGTAAGGGATSANSGATSGATNGATNGATSASGSGAGGGANGDTPGSSGGCGCRAASDPTSLPMGVAGMLLAIAAIARRRRARVAAPSSAGAKTAHGRAVVDDEA